MESQKRGHTQGHGAHHVANHATHHMGRSKVHKILIISIITVLVLIVIVVAVLLIKKGTEGTPDSISEQCAFACETNQKGAFCDVQRFVDDTRVTCNELSTNSEYSKYNVETCASVSCSTQTIGQTCSDIGGSWETLIGESCPSQEGMFVRKRTASDQAPIEGQVCCYYYE